MKNIIYINYEKKSWVTVIDNKVTEFNKISNNIYKKGNILVGRITDIVPSLNGYFVNVGDAKKGFLHKKYLNHKLNEKILVQIKKEKIEDKGVLLSDEVSFVGDYVIGKLRGKNGVSNKIINVSRKEELLGLINNIDFNGAFVFRTYSENAINENILNDIKNLKSIIEDCINNIDDMNVGRVVFEEPLLNISLNDIDFIMINDVTKYNELITKYGDKLKLYTKDYDIYDFYSLTGQLNTMNHKKIWLKNGGYILFEYTSAMTVIDVNTGKSSNKNINANFLEVNLLASIEIVKQIILRNIGGIIIIDFINMKGKENKKKVELKVSELLEKDSRQSIVGGFTKLDNFEITREKKGPIQRYD